MLNIILQNKRFIFVIALMTLFTSLLTVAIPILLTQIFYSNYALNTLTLYLVIICMTITYIIQIIMVIVRENFALKFNKRYATHLYQNVHQIKYDELLRKEPTYLIDRVGQAVTSLYFFITQSLIVILSNALILIMCMIIVFYVNVFMTLLLFLLVPINFFGYKMINARLKEKSIQMQKETSTGYKEIIAVYKNVDMMKQENFERIEHMISPSIEKIYKSMASVNQFGQSSSLVIKLINTFIQNLMFFILAYLIIIGKTNVEDWVIISVILPIYFISLQAFTNVNLEFRDLQASKTFLDSEVLIHRENNQHLTMKTIDSISFEHPSIQINERKFNYDLKRQFLKGDVIFVSGPSGKGKSTLMKALLNFRASTGIKINNIPIDTFDKYVLREKILYISQDMPVLPMTIKDNVLYGKNDDAIEWNQFTENIILKSILNHKNIDEVVYEGGTNFSGGEKQRLMFARILHENVDCIILDEATSHIDKSLENQIFRFLVESYTDKIIFVISHNLENKQYCNQFLEIN